jgi:hypothetical protein
VPSAAAGTAGKTNRRFKRSGSGKGKFIGGYKKPEGFKDFKTFYKDAKETLGADEAKKMLATSRSKSGEDYSWGKKHQKTWDAMQSRKTGAGANKLLKQVTAVAGDVPMNSRGSNAPPKWEPAAKNSLGQPVDDPGETAALAKLDAAEPDQREWDQDDTITSVSDQDLSTGSKAIGLGSTGGLKLNETFARWKKIINHNK